jgi:hypothetical protein
MCDTHTQTSNTQIRTAFKRFSEFFQHVYDNGMLRLGSAAFLSNEWKPVEARAIKCSQGTSSKAFHQDVEAFGHLLADFNTTESLYDIILEHRGTASDDDE